MLFVEINMKPLIIVREEGLIRNHARKNIQEKKYFPSKELSYRSIKPLQPTKKSTIFIRAVVFEL